MAEHSLTPYLFSVSPRWKPTDRLKMNNLDQEKGINGADLAANTFLTLQQESDSRKFGNDNTRLLDVVRVLRSGDQVLCELRLGVKGFNSSLELSHSGVSAIRKFDDPEWFNLRALFVSIGGGRNALFLVERVSTYSAYGALSEIIKGAVKTNLTGDLSSRFEPIQDIKTMGESLGDMLTKAVEFRAVLPPGTQDPADEAAGENNGQPFRSMAQPALKRYTKYHQRGGLGAFSRFRGKNVDELAEVFGYVPDSAEQTEVVATVENSKGKPRNVSIQREELQSVSFNIERESTDSDPTDTEFFAAVEEVLEGTKSLLGTTSLKANEPSSFEEVTKLNNAENWKLDV